jgi:hypothetical protein
MTRAQEKLIEKYNEDPERIELVYGKDRGEMLQYFIKLGLLEHINEELFDDYLDLVLYEKLNNASPENKMEIAKSIAEKYLSNEVVFEDGKIYYDADVDDIDQIFYDGRDGDRYIVNKVLASEYDFWEPFQDVVSNYSFYNECVETLTDENKRLLSEKLYEVIGGRVVAYTHLLEEIAEEQGNENYVDLSVELIYDRLLDSRETSDYLLNGETEIGDELKWRYNDAYNQVAVDEFYGQVISGINSFFNSDKDPERYTSKYVSQYTNKEVFSEKLRIDITRSFYDFLLRYLSNWNDAIHYNNNIDYYGSFSQIIKILIDWGELKTVSIRTETYPDSNEVENLYNEIIVGDVI